MMRLNIFKSHGGLLRAIFFALIGCFVLIFVPYDHKTPESMPIQTICQTCPKTAALGPMEMIRLKPRLFNVSVSAPEPSIPIDSTLNVSVSAPEPSIPIDSIFVEPEIEKEPARYGFTDEDLYLLTVLLSGSKDVDGDGEFDVDFGRSDEYDQISLVLGVVMNRVRSDLYPNTVSEVVWQKGQFEVMPRWKKGLPKVSDISYKRVVDWCTAYDSWDPGAQSIPTSHLYFRGDGHKNHSR